MSLKHAILAMLDLEKGTGYDIVKRFNLSIGHFWSSSHQQVYKELHKLHDDGLVEFEAVEQAGKPDKKVYYLTDAGLKALKLWVRQPARAFKIKEPLLVKLFAGRHGNKDELLEELARHEQLHRETAEQYSNLESQMEHLSPRQRKKYLLPYMTLRLGVHFEKAWLTWLAEVRNVIRDELD